MSSFIDSQGRLRTSSSINYPHTTIMGLSTDTKPSATTYRGYLFLETDTGDTFWADSGQWNSVMPAGGTGPSIVTTFTNKTMDFGANTFENQGPYEFYIYISGSNYVCRNTSTGTIVSTNTDAAVVINYAIQNATGAIFIKQGQYLCGSQLNFSGFNARLVGEMAPYGSGGTGNTATDTILKKNYTDNVNGFIKIYGTPTFMKVQLENLVIVGDNNGIGIDCSTISEVWDFLNNVSIFHFNVGIQFLTCFELGFRSCFIANNATYGVFYNSSASAQPNFNHYWYGGGITDNPINVNCAAAASGHIALDDAYFYSTSLEGSSTNAVVINSGNTNIRFIGCSFENAITTSQISDGGTNNSYINNRFGNATVSSTTIGIIHFTSTAFGMNFISNQIDLLNTNQTWNILIDSGAANINIFGNMLNNNETGGSLTLTNNTTYTNNIKRFGNYSLADSVLGLQATSINDINNNVLIELDPNINGTGVMDYFGNTIQGFHIGPSVSINDGNNIALGSTTGTKIGTATTQKLGFYNTTPIVQPALISAPSGGTTIDTQARTAISSILTLLTNLGLMA